MSAFLGKIHYLLYNKIQVQENLLEDVLNFAKENGIPVEKIKAEVYEKYGYPERRALENVIDNGNIHGWLQAKIQSVESRTAAIVTKLINDYLIKIDEISKIYFENGRNVMKAIGEYNFSPRELFELIFEYMLEGMPCDRVNEVIADSEDEFCWKTTVCIHKQHWDEVQGDVSNFYVLRNSWINGFLSLNSKKYSYTRTDDGYNKIRKD